MCEIIDEIEKNYFGDSDCYSFVNKLKTTLENNRVFLQNKNCKKRHKSLKDKELGRIEFLVIGMYDEDKTIKNFEEKEFIDCIITWTKSEDDTDNVFSKVKWLNELGYSNILAINTNTIA